MIAVSAWSQEDMATNADDDRLVGAEQHSMTFEKAGLDVRAPDWAKVTNDKTGGNCPCKVSLIHQDTFMACDRRARCASSNSASH